jgi:hypothetical protein
MKKNTIEPKIVIKDIIDFLRDNSVAKKVATVAFVIGGIYIAGKLANGMASTIRGFRNLTSAFKGN